MISPILAASILLASIQVMDRDVLVEGKKLHYLEAGSGSDEPRPTVLLLHGARYSSANWRELGTLDVLADAGYHVLAVDLPGFGRSEPTSLKPEDYLVAAMDALGVRSAVVVSPSMSGQYSFPFVTRFAERVDGFVPVAPGGMDRYLKSLRKTPVRALVLWGEKDEIIPVERSDELVAAIPGSRRVIFKGAGHACYLDVPTEFHRELLTFLRDR